MPDSGFEIAFSDLAHASLADKAPGLMEYLVGFQLLDKNDEETHAVAVFGFKVGNQWFYAPVFFLNGTLKGTELLWVKNQDLFVPQQDNWVNYLLSKRPRNLGQAEQVPESQLKLDGPDFRVFSETPATAGSKWASAIAPNAIKEWARPFLPIYRELMDGFQKRAADLSERLDLRSVLQRAPILAPTLAATMRANAKFAEAVLSFYDLSDVLPDTAAVKAAVDMAAGTAPKPKIQGSTAKTFKLPKSAPQVGQSLGKQPGMAGYKTADVLAELTGGEKKAELVGDNHKYGYAKHYNTTDEVLNSLVETRRGQVKKASDQMISNEGKEKNKIEVYTQEDVPAVLTKRDGSATLTDTEKEQLQRGEVVVRDYRDNTSRVYEAEFERHLTNPSESGVYDVLTSLGKFERCLILNDPKTIGKGRTSAICTLVSLDSGRWGNFRNIDILVHRAEQGVASFQDRFKEAFDTAKDLSAMKSGYLYVLVGPNGLGTIPFKFLTKLDRNDGTSVYAVRPETYVTRGKNSVRSTMGYNRGFRMEEGISLESYDSDCYCCEPTPVDGKKRPYYNWELRDARQLVVSDRSNYTTLKNTGSVSFVPAAGWKALEIGASTENELATEKEKAFKFEPGSLMDAETYILKLGAHDLIVQKDGPEFVVRHEGGQQRLRKTAAIKHLIVDWQLRQDDAELLVKRAADKLMVQCFVKLAQGLETPPGAPAFPPYRSEYSTQLGAPIQEQQTDFVDVMGMKPTPANRYAYKLMGDPEVQNALASASKGQKEIFDTSVVNGLVKAVDVDALVDSFLPDMIKGMDRVGRALFLFYWHNDNFRERYGRQDLVELEDSLRNVFKSSGDLVLFLKQKTIDAEPMTDAIDIDLEA